MTLPPKRTLRPIIMHSTIFQIVGRKVCFGRNILGRIVLEPISQKAKF